MEEQIDKKQTSIAIYKFFTVVLALSFIAAAGIGYYWKISLGAQLTLEKGKVKILSTYTLARHNLNQMEWKVRDFSDKIGEAEEKLFIGKSKAISSKFTSAIQDKITKFISMDDRDMAAKYHALGELKKPIENLLKITDSLNAASVLIPSKEDPDRLSTPYGKFSGYLSSLLEDIDEFQTNVKTFAEAQSINFADKESWAVDARIFLMDNLMISFL